MKATLHLVPALGALLLLAVACSRPNAASVRADKIAYGRHLALHVAGCVDCHSPRGPDGQFVPGKELTGSPLFFKPIHPMPAWAAVAPRLAGLPTGFTEDQLVTFLMTGRTPKGVAPARPPMPPFRMNRHEAEAVAAYLKSLGGGNGS